MHAQILAQLLDGRRIHTPPFFSEILLVAAIAGLAFAVSQMEAAKTREFSLSVGALALLFIGGGLLFREFHFVLPSATVTLAWPLELMANLSLLLDGIKPLLLAKSLSVPEIVSAR